MKKQIYLIKKKQKYTYSKKQKIKINNKKSINHRLKKIVAIFILIFSLIIHFLRKKNIQYKIEIETNGEKEKINLLNLPLNEHYKILLPKVKITPHVKR